MNPYIIVIDNIVIMEHDTVFKSLEYYDKNCEKYKSRFKNVKYVGLKFDKADIERNTIYLLDKNKEVIKTYPFEIIGTFNTKSNIWTWSWSVPHFHKNSTTISRKILNYGLDLTVKHMFLKSELITSRFKIDNDIQIDMHVAIASYLSKTPLIYQIKINNDNDNGKGNAPIKVDQDCGPDSNCTIYYLFLFE